ncbi:MAG: hypothetical protein ACETWM_03720 [Candidatus Lokiarchaeia archaeon]
MDFAIRRTFDNVYLGISIIIAINAIVTPKITTKNERNEKRNPLIFEIKLKNLMFKIYNNANKNRKTLKNRFVSKKAKINEE